MAADLLRRGIPPGAGFFYHVPNQGRRSIAGHMVTKGMGMIPGLSDLVLVAKVATGAETGFLELKRPDGKGRLRKGQEDFRDLCQGLAIPWAMAANLQEVEAFARRFYEDRGHAFRARVQ